MSELPNEHKVLLKIVGARGDYASELVKFARDIGVGERVELVEWIPLEEVPTTILECDIGIIPHKKHPHTDATIPHKLFQYMLASRPVIVSNCRPLERIVNETKAGIVFESGNPSDLLEKMLRLITNPDLCLELGSNGREASMGYYSWEIEGQKLVDLYNKFL